jgi:hypothetical protein
MLPEPIAATITVTATLEKLGVRYLIGGSLASTVHGMVRTTQDSDIVAELHPQHVEPFIQALEGEFYVDEESVTAAVARHTSFNLIHRASMFKVDVFVPLLRPFVKEQFARARRQVFVAEPRVEAMVATAEDTLLAKLEWYRMGGEVSERQWRDVLGIIKVQAGNLDQDYLRRWARELKVSDLLEQALTESTVL